MRKIFLGLILLGTFTYANKFNVGDIAYLCAGTIFGEKSMCKTEVLDTDGERIKVLHLTNCTSIASKGHTEWSNSANAGTVSEVRSGLRCQ
jgi:hypothetical protein